MTMTPIRTTEPERVVTVGVTEAGDPVFDTSWKKAVDEGKPVILITKNFPKLFKEVGMRDNVMYHATVTGFGDSIYEPNVPKAGRVIEALATVSVEYRNHVTVRIDPIVPTEAALWRPIGVYKWAINNHYRVLISFLDAYPHAMKRLKVIEQSAREGIMELLREGLQPDVQQRLARSYDEYQMYDRISSLYDGEFHAPLETRLKVWKDDFPEADVCGEPGIECAGCVGQRACDVLKVPFVGGFKAQRPECQCGAQKYELLKKKKRCAHGCWYCYHHD